MPSTRTLLGIVLSAALLWAASPAVGVGWLTWIALVPVASAMLEASHPRESRLAVPLMYVLYLDLLLVPSLPFGLTRGEWGDPVVPVLIGDSPVLFTAVVYIPAIGALLYLVRFGQPWAASLAPGRLHDVVTVVVPACAWTGLDYLRVKLDPSGLWGPLYLTQADRGVGRMAALVGPWLLTTVIVAVNYMLALALTRRRRTPGIAGVTTLAAVMLLSSLAWGPEPRTSLKVAVIQPGYDRVETLRRTQSIGTEEARNAELASLATDLCSLTRRAARRGASLIVLPEAVRYLADDVPQSALTDLGECIASRDAVLVATYFLPRKARSHAVLMSAGGGSTSPHVKARPMWYLGEQGGDRRPLPLVADGLHVGTLLGTDSFDPLIPARMARNGALILVSSTHDWHASSRQQHAAARISAIASGRSLARADWRYASAIFGPRGEVLADTGRHRARRVILANAPLTDSLTGYTRVGDLWAWTATSVACGAWLASVAGRHWHHLRRITDA